MGFFDLFQQADIDQGVRNIWPRPVLSCWMSVPLKNTETAISPAAKMFRFRLLTRWPLSQKIKIWHCMSTATLAPGSRQAAGLLRRMGYRNVNNIGGIAAYAGKVER